MAVEREPDSRAKSHALQAIMKRIRRTKITVEHCRVIVTAGSDRIRETVTCPDCGRLFNPGDPIKQLASCATGEPSGETNIDNDQPID